MAPPKKVTGPLLARAFSARFLVTASMDSAMDIAATGTHNLVALAPPFAFLASVDSGLLGTNQPLGS